MEQKKKETKERDLLTCATRRLRQREGIAIPLRRAEVLPWPDYDNVKRDEPQPHASDILQRNEKLGRAPMSGYSATSGLADHCNLHKTALSSQN
jgi:hypothetical protein